MVAKRKRARADQGHVAAQDVEQFGSSSRESRRSQRPTRVTRGSSRILKSAPAASFVSSNSSCSERGVGDHRA